MNKDELIVRLTRELYDTKQKLNDIRVRLDVCYDIIRLTKKKAGLPHVIEALNLIDNFEDYDDAD